MSAQDVVGRFISFLRAKGAKEHTIKTYMRFVNKLLNTCEQLTKDCVMNFIARYRDKSLLTQATCAYSLRAFFEANPDFGIDYKEIPLPSRVEPSRKIVIIPEQVIRRMAESEEIKVGAMLALMYEVGLRVSEVGRITCGDVNLDEWTIYVRRSKGSVSSTLPIVTEWVKDLVRAYMAIRDCQDPNEPLFEGYGGKGISYTRVSTIIKEVLCRYGYCDAHPHDIRHSRGTNLLKAGVDVVTVSSILGHKTLTSTSRYLHLVVDDIRKKLEEAAKKTSS
jgi:site-specific recombinase XerD